MPMPAAGGAGWAAAVALLASITAQAAVQVRTLAAGAFEASGATSVPSGEGLLFVDDGRPGEVLWMRVGGDGSAGAIVPVRLAGGIADPEGITNDGTWIYIVGSQSRGGKNGADLLRFRFDAANGTTTSVESLSGLSKLLEPAVSGARAGEGMKSSGLNIEGLAWDAQRKRLLIGLRSPLADDDALVVPAAVADGPLRRGSVSVEPAMRLPLGGNGIRSMEQVGDGGFLIVAGGVNDASDFRLLSWSGRGAPKPVTDLPPALKPEGVARVRAGGRSVTVLLGDSGRYAVLD
jgi:hypothetical protein